MRCSVWSASIWTSKGRASFVLGVSDEQQPLLEPAHWQVLQKQLLAKLGGRAWNARVRRDQVVRTPRTAWPCPPSCLQPRDAR